MSDIDKVIALIKEDVRRLKGRLKCWPTEAPFIMKELSKKEIDLKIIKEYKKRIKE